jgi:N-formylglutamate amidohydrolase
MDLPFCVSTAPGRVVSTAVHAGHQLRPETAALVGLDDATRRREEDPYTDQLMVDVGTRVSVQRSRFEVDLNRARDEAVYLDPADAWGLDVWTHRPPPAVIARSLAIHDEFYAVMADHMDALAATGSFLVLDIHSYNHRRDGPDAPPASPVENPEVNVGTGALDGARWGDVVDEFIAALAGASVEPLDVRENVRFRGGHLSRWVAQKYPDTACVLALEFKKTFMDEWTDRVVSAELVGLRDALAVATRSTLATLAA